MKITEGTSLPDATFLRMGEKGPETVELSSFLEGRKVVLFALPGAYTGTCTKKHLPSFVETAPQFRDKGIDEIACISVNDPFVLAAWGEATGATAAGISFLGDADGSFTKAIGMDFTAPPIGLIDRSNRYAIVVDDGVITAAKVDSPGECALSTGAELLAMI